MRFRLYPTPAQEAVMVEHCAHARYVWNLALEQFNCWQRELGSTPGYVEQSRQLTEARAVSPWLAAGSHMVQQQALRDFDQARSDFFARCHGRPTWRRRGQHEGFRIVAAFPVVRLGKHWGQVHIPKVGEVRFRWSRQAPKAKSFRVNLDRSGRWHVGFQGCPPSSIVGPGDGSVVGVDRGVSIPFACSDGRRFHIAGLSASERHHLLRLQRQLARQVMGSARRERTRLTLAKLRSREVDRRRDAVEKATTELAITVDLLCIEDLRTQKMTRSPKGTVGNPGRNIKQKSGLNRAVRSSGWGLFARRLKDKAEGRVHLVDPAFTSQRCSVCGHVAKENRESQAVFRCVNCGHTENADINAAKNIAAGHAVTGQGGMVQEGRPLNCQPQLALSA